MTFAWFTFVAGVVIGVVVGYFISSSRLETKFIRAVSALKEEVTGLRGEVAILKDALLRSEEEREKLARFNVLIPEIIRKLTTNVFSDDIPFIAVRTIKSFFGAGLVAFFRKESEDEYILKMGAGYADHLNGTLRVRTGEGIVGISLEQRKTLSAEDYTDLERYSRVSLSEFERKGLKAQLVTPIIGVEGIYGAVAVADMSFRLPEEKRYLSMIGDIIGLSYDKAKIILDAELADVIDEMCGVYSKDYFAQRFVSELRKADNYLLPLSLVMLQIDGFEETEGRGSPGVRDAIVQFVAGVAREKTRRADFVARVDTDRFVIVMVASTKEQAYVHGERLCNAISSARLSIPDEREDVSVTVSGGVSGYHIDGDQPADLIRASEEALRVARSSGGNRVVKHERERRNGNA
ncbi:MAG: diguanylate cyclase [Deltaproteobacteria bacterium]|nr:diguanylate cyclase [Deltaproteobacteria bacterium]NIS77972.1 diguanylate cyclase [Deltaproteobacteria bacterium]